MFVSVQVWKRWIIVSGPCMRIEQNEDITFPNLKKILLKYPILRNNLYWKMRRFASLVTGTSKVGSSHQRCSIKKGVFRNFTKVTGKHLCQSLFFDKVAGLRHRKSLFLTKLQAWRPVTYLKKVPTQRFFCEICEIFKSTFFYRIPPVAAFMF